MTPFSTSDAEEFSDVPSWGSGPVNGFAERAAAALDPFEGAQAVWSAVTIEEAKIGQTSDAAASYEHMLDPLVSAPSD